MSVMLLMATSSVTGSSVGDRNKASATGVAFPGLSVSWYEYSCDFSRMSYSRLGAFPSGFARIATSGLWSVTTVTSGPYV